MSRIRGVVVDFLAWSFPTMKQKVLKSYSKKTDVLTLLCEWKDCMAVYDRSNYFLSHVCSHVSSETGISESDLGCFWRDCAHEGSFASAVDFSRHVYFHAFHQKLKCIGVSLLKKNNLKKCLIDSSNRNVIPDLPDLLVCGWQGCQESFDCPELFYDHVTRHIEIYPKGNRPSGGCRCLWDGCQTVVNSKHRLKEHLRSHTQEKAMACPTCGGLFANATKFFDHIQRQTDSTTHKYQCSHCNKRCSTERLLRDHMRHHVYHYKCPFCNMTCPNPSSLRIHIHYRHTEDRPYLCQSCEYRGKSAVDLRRHQETHEPQWIQCDINNCKFRARYFWEMNLHIRNVHQGVEPAKYLCHICSHKYSRGTRLTKHLKRKHRFKWPSGHTRFRYKQHEDGYYRLQAIRYESLELREQSIRSDLVANESSNNQIVESSPETSSKGLNISGSMSETVGESNNNNLSSPDVTPPTRSRRVVRKADDKRKRVCSNEREMKRRRACTRSRSREAECPRAIVITPQSEDAPSDSDFQSEKPRRTVVSNGKGRSGKMKGKRRPDLVPIVVNNSMEENEQQQNSGIVEKPVKSVDDQAFDLAQLCADTKYGVQQEMQATGVDWICDFSLQNSQDTTDSSGNIVLNLVAVMPDDSQHYRKNSFGASLYGSIVKDERDEYIDVVSAVHEHDRSSSDLLGEMLNSPNISVMVDNSSIPSRGCSILRSAYQLSNLPSDSDSPPDSPLFCKSKVLPFVSDDNFVQQKGLFSLVMEQMQSQSCQITKDLDS